MNARRLSGAEIFAVLVSLASVAISVLGNRTQERLLAAREASDPCYRELHLSLAASWLSLAQQNETVEQSVRDRGSE